MNKGTLKKLASIVPVFIIIFAIAAFFVMVYQNQNSAAQTIRVACVGDSLTQSSGYPRFLWDKLGTSYTVGNFGVGGTTVLLNTETPYMHTSAYKDALAFQPDIVIIMLGTNDAQPNLKQYNASFVGDYVKLINSFKALESKPEIWIVLPPPIFSNQSGRMDPVYFTNTIIPDIRQAANQTNLPIINVYSALEDHPNYFPDGLHPNRSGAELIANEIYNSIS